MIEPRQNKCQKVLELLSVCYLRILVCTIHLASFPGLRPDFISQPWRKVDFSPRLQDKVWAEAWERGYYTQAVVSFQDPKHTHTKKGSSDNTTGYLTIHGCDHDDVISKFQAKIAQLKFKDAQKSGEKGNIYSFEGQPHSW